MKATAAVNLEPWNKGKLVGPKAPLRISDIWATRARLQLAERTRDLAVFELAIDSKLRACDLTTLRVGDIARAEQKLIVQCSLKSQRGQPEMGGYFRASLSLF